MRIDFNSSQNEDFARDMGFPRYPLDDATQWIQDNLAPDDVFTEEQLETWAEENGFVKGE
jgi:hypothetical protein